MQVGCEHPASDLQPRWRWATAIIHPINQSLTHFRMTAGCSRHPSIPPSFHRSLYSQTLLTFQHIDARTHAHPLEACIIRFIERSPWLRMRKNTHTHTRRLAADSWLLNWLKCETKIIGFGLRVWEQLLQIPLLGGGTGENLTEVTVCFSHQSNSAPTGEGAGFQKRAGSSPCPPLSRWLLAQVGNTGRSRRMCWVFSGATNKGTFCFPHLWRNYCWQLHPFRIWWPVSTATFTFVPERRGLPQGEKNEKNKEQSFHSMAGNIKTAKHLSWSGIRDANVNHFASESITIFGGARYTGHMSGPQFKGFVTNLLWPFGYLPFTFFFWFLWLVSKYADSSSQHSAAVYQFS